MQEFIGYESKKRDGSYADGTILSIARLNAWVTCGERFPVERENRKRHQQKEYGAMYTRMVDAPAR